MHLDAIKVHAIEVFKAGLLTKGLSRKRVNNIEPDDGDATDAWTDEIRRRIDEVEAGTAELHDFDTVRARLEAAGRA